MFKIKKSKTNQQIHVYTCTYVKGKLLQVWGFLWVLLINNSGLFLLKLSVISVTNNKKLEKWGDFFFLGGVATVFF